jgi:hypothetical protein
MRSLIRSLPQSSSPSQLLSSLANLPVVNVEKRLACAANFLPTLGFRVYIVSIVHRVRFVIRLNRALGSFGDTKLNSSSTARTGGRAMAPEKCLHPNRVTGVVALDFSRLEAPDHPAYSGSVSVGVCEECGHVELYAQFHHALCDWLRTKTGKRSSRSSSKPPKV